MPSLEWIGKEKVVNHHLEVPYHVLQRQYSYDENGQHEVDNGSENMIIHGDNLLALKSLLPKYEGRVSCIYIDPPYNTGNEGWVYNDNVNDPRIKKWLGEVVGKEGDDLSRHDKWLCMMYPRLKLLQRLLADDGAIFISIDDNEQANLKLICDEIFGGNNFISDIACVNKPSGRSDDKYIATAYEHILIYKNIGECQFYGFEAGNHITKRYSKIDKSGRKYREEDLRKRGTHDTRNDRPNLFYPFYYQRLCHNKQLINSHFYRGVSELPYKLLFAVIYTHLEFRYEVSHTITSHHVHHFHQTRIPDGTLLDYMVQYRKPLFPQFFLYPKKFLPENNPHHKEFHLRPYIQNNANQ